MAKDFKASQVRTTQIIASGSTSGKPSLVILSASSPGVNFDGDGISNVPSAVGRDVFVFVSGSTNSFGTSTRGVTLFGGDIVVSGNLYNGSGGSYGNVAGSNKQVQFNDAGSFGASSGLIYDKTPQALSVGTLYVTGTGNSLNVSGSVTIAQNLTVNGTTTTVSTQNLVVKDPLIYFGSSSLGGSFNNNGGIALASGSAQANEALVWGRVALNTWGAGKKDVTAGTITDLTDMTLVPIRSSKFELGGVANTVNNASFISSSLSTNIIISSTSTQITGTFSQGNNAQASGDYSHAQGGSTLATGVASHAEGDNTISSGLSSHSEGISTTASGEGSHAEGANTTAEGDFSHSEGYKTLASAQYTHAEGYYTTASWAYSHAEGWNTIANALYSHTEGQDTIVEGAGNAGHAEGASTRVTGDSAHAEGNRTLASGIASHAEGYFTTASGQSSHAQGYYSITEGNYSFAGGQYTIASGAYQTVLGQYNKRNNSTSLFVIGNGTGDSNSDRSDIFLIDSNTIRIGSGSNLGTDTFLFVSGANGSRGTSTKGVAVFGGDVVISGTLHGGSPLKVSGSMALSGSLRMQTQDSAPDVGINESVLYVLNDGGTKKLYWKNSDGTQQQVGTSTSGTFNEVNSGGTISLVTTASVSLAGAKGFNYGVNQVGSDTFFFVSGSLSGRGNSSGEVAVFGGHTVFSGAIYGGVNSDLSRTLLRQEATQIAFSKEDGLTAGNVAGTDVFMFVSGAIGSKDTATRGTAVFGGDAVISGNLHGGSRDLQITSNTIITGTLEVTGNVKLYSDVILGTAGGSGPQITRAGDTSKIGFSNDGTIQLDTSNAPGAGVVKFAKNATQYLIISQTNTAGNLASIATLKAGNSEGIFGFTSLTGNNLSDAGTDTFFYVSGSAGSKDTFTRGVAVFGGDVVVSGTLHGGSPLKVGGSIALTGSLYLESQGSAPAVGNNESVLYVLDSGGTKKLYWKNSDGIQQEVGTGGGSGATSGTFNEVNSAGTISLVTTASVSLAGAKGFNYGVNQIGSDTFFFVSGSSGTKNSGNRGVSVFGGDTVMSGAVYVDVSGMPTIFSRNRGTDANLVLSGGYSVGGITKPFIQTETTNQNVSFAMKDFAGSKVEFIRETDAQTVAFISGSGYISGSTVLATKLSGSLTTLGDGTPYLLAGSNVTLTTGSNGAVTIASTGGGSGTPGGSDTQVQFNDGGSSFGGDSGLTYIKGTDTLNVVNVSMVATNDQVFQLKDNSAGALNIGAGTDNKWTFNTGNGQERLGFWDGVRASFGDINDPDLNIQHDGTNSLITNKTGALVLSGANGMVLSGTVTPGVDLAYNLGSPTNRFGNIYTGDLHLRNDRGNWTIVEEEDYLCVVNNKTGKKFKMALIPLEE